MHAHNYRAIYGNTLWMVLMMALVIFGGKAMLELEYDRKVETTCRGDDCGGEAQATAKLEHLTLIFNTFVFLQFWNILNAKEVNPKKVNPFANLFGNWLLLGMLVLIFVIQYIACFWEMGTFFETTIVTESVDFSIGVAIGASVLVAAIIFKYVPLQFFEKLPMLDEEKALGGDSQLMAFYDKQANAKVVKKRDATVDDVDPANDDGFQQLDV